MLPEYEPFCVADPWFYERPAGPTPYAVRQFRPVLDREAQPTGWRRFDTDDWIHFIPEGQQLPPQGWKVHVSAHMDNADRIVSRVWDYCVENRISFKLAPSPVAFLFRISKYASRVSSGKLFTIYPADDDMLLKVLTGLGEELRGEAGPYILSDVRWEDGPLYTRYGAFAKRTMLDGSGRPAIVDPEGNLVPDPRDVVFSVPDWVTVPDFLRPAIERHRRPVMDEFPYRVEEALHFSNGGGVYRGVERRTGRQVVVKEGRPYAGLDANQRDAVTRLRHERAMLERVAGIPAVPELLDYLAVEDHEFLVQEYIDGDSLQAELAKRSPLIKGRAPSRDELEEYVEWGLGIWRQTAEALEQVHDAGVVFGDLHVRNILVGSADGRVRLVDWEVAHPSDEPPSSTLGNPAFTAPGDRRGVERDLSALALLKLSIFAPVTSLAHLSDVKLGQVAELIHRHFPVERGAFADELDLIHPPGEAAGRATAPLSPDEIPSDPEAWEAACAALSEGILDCATPGRLERLFPGDIVQFREAHGGLSFANGAAGVLWALDVAGGVRYRKGEGWLLKKSMGHREEAEPGFYNGDHGIAYTLWHLGHRDEAVSLLERAERLPPERLSNGLYDGLAGVGLNCLHFHRETGEERFLSRALRSAELLRSRLEQDFRTEVHLGRQPAPGLLWGHSGVAVFLMDVFEASGDKAWLELAADVLRLDLKMCTEDIYGALYVKDGARLLPYLGVGSVGVGLALRRYLHHVDDAELAGFLAAVERATGSSFYLFPGLFEGAAGIIAFLTQLDAADPVAHRRRLVGQVRVLNWHVLRHDGKLAFPGNQLLRLSTDLASGSAGVLLALAAAAAAVRDPHRPPAITLPFVSPPTPPGPRLPASPDRRHADN